ncbi:MAG: sulfurtransferase [Gammaproteobacteria bacterium]|nr:sulfurtransferase [Gammaproteobacteria bacterium]|tara:strand:- start:5466 stop:6308 length:843 start_codon:yes stop_codon:yes gene_type:complete
MFSYIISPENLLRNLEKEDWVIFDCRFNLLKKSEGEDLYKELHIKNSYYINLERDLSDCGKDGGRHPLPNIEQFMEVLNRYGVDKKTQIVLYDDNKGAICSRFWWMLKNVGHINACVLDGGYSAWKGLSYPLTSNIPPKRKKLNNSYSYNNEEICTTEEIKKLLDENKIILVDAREENRYLGKEEKIDKKSGHIPGSINSPYAANINEKGFFKSNEELIKKFEILLNDSSKEIVHMCGSGVTACHNLLAVDLTQKFGVQKIYIGSWSAWIEDENNEVGSG